MVVESLPPKVANLTYCLEFYLQRRATLATYRYPKGAFIEHRWKGTLKAYAVSEKRYLLLLAAEVDCSVRESILNC